MKTKALYGILFLIVLIAACGGSSSDGGGTSSSTYSLTGTVPGTLIEAYCDDGSYYSVKSTDNGTDRHPFDLELPKNLSCRVVLITNEENETTKVVTSIKLTDKDGNTSIVFTSSGEDIDLGFVDLPLSRSDMSSDSNGDGVEDFPLEVTVTDSAIVIVLKTDDPMDDDNDGIINVYEDDDGDGISNRDDDDDDNDGIKDIDDNDNDGDGINDNDLDHDGISNGQDKDDDNDGLPDKDDPDDDNDGINDDQDDDDDNDGISDANDDDEINDSDDDGIRDDYDTDNDNDGINNSGAYN